MDKRIIETYALIQAGMGDGSLLEEMISEELNIPLNELKSLYDFITTKIKSTYGLGLANEQFKNLIYLEYLNQLEER